MKTTTLRDLLTTALAAHDTSDQLSAAVAAAYWAGQADARHRERQALADRVSAADLGRYHHVARRLIEQITPARERRAATGLAAERDELLNWDFAL
jgi:hypothetical protein